MRTHPAKQENNTYDSTQKSICIERIDPPFWYIGMKSPRLQLMVYGKNIAWSTVQAKGNGVQLHHVVRLESPNYLFIYLDLNGLSTPGNIRLTFHQRQSEVYINYTLKPRRHNGYERKGFDASDVLYLLIPDRFANGNPANDYVRSMSAYKVDRNNPDARHGGDLKGIEQHLDYLYNLGVTALWLTPIQENNMPGGSYHGYAITEHYRVDPRLGTNEDYLRLVNKAHAKGLKVVMDMIFNHCGTGHRWCKDPPSSDWFNHSDRKSGFEQTSFRLTPHTDPYASQHDFLQMSDGWFARSMPDLNQRNPHVWLYLVQNSFWWIEYADIDGIRMDTYPYADYNAMSRWMKALNDEYPFFNVVGETWVTEPAYTAWWQKDSRLSYPKNSHLKTVMDFAFFDRINKAKNEQSDAWMQGLDRLYTHFTYDFLYPHPESILAFLDNHDTERFLGTDVSPAVLKQALTLLLTTRRIPQLYYGTEIGMNGLKGTSDGNVRQDFPGGWPNDKISAFNAEGRTAVQNEYYDFCKKLLQWRRNNAPIISSGRMVQFAIQDGIYAYARLQEGHTIFVALNGTDRPATLHWDIYEEVLGGSAMGKDIISGRSMSLSRPLQMSPRESLVLELCQ